MCSDGSGQSISAGLTVQHLYRERPQFRSILFLLQLHSVITRTTDCDGRTDEARGEMKAAASAAAAAAVELKFHGSSFLVASS